MSSLTNRLRSLGLSTLGVLAPVLFTASLSAQDGPAVIALTPPPGGLTTVYVDLYGIQIFSINEREETFEIEAFIEALWIDERLAFEPLEDDAASRVYQGEGATELLKDGIWWPYFEILDARTPRERMYTELEIRSDGLVYYRERFHVFIQQDFNLESFPFDQHEISFSVEPFSYETDVVQFEPMADPEETDWQPQDWAVTWSDLIITNDGFANATVSMQIARKFRHHVTKVILPLALIIAVSSAVFWMSFETMHLGDRLSVSFTSVLTVVAFDFVTSESLPKLAYSTVLDDILSLSYLFLAVNIFENVLANQLHESRPRWTKRLDVAFRWLYVLTYFLAIAALSRDAWTL